MLYYLVPGLVWSRKTMHKKVKDFFLKKIKHIIIKRNEYTLMNLNMLKKLYKLLIHKYLLLLIRYNSMCVDCFIIYYFNVIKIVTLNEITKIKNGKQD